MQCWLDSSSINEPWNTLHISAAIKHTAKKAKPRKPKALTLRTKARL